MDGREDDEAKGVWGLGGAIEGGVDEGCYPRGDGDDPLGQQVRALVKVDW